MTAVVRVGLLALSMLQLANPLPTGDMLNFFQLVQPKAGTLMCREKGNEFNLPNSLPSQPTLFTVDLIGTDTKGDCTETLTIYSGMRILVEGLRKSPNGKSKVSSFLGTKHNTTLVHYDEFDTKSMVCYL